MPMISEMVVIPLRWHVRAGARLIIGEAQCSCMIDLTEFLYLAIAGAVLIVALIAYNKFGKVKEE